MEILMDGDYRGDDDDGNGGSVDGLTHCGLVTPYSDMELGQH